MFRTKVVEKNKKLCHRSFFLNRAVYEIMWKNKVEPGRPQMTILRMHIACWIPKAAKYTPMLCNARCFFSATMVARTSLHVTLPVLLCVLLSCVTRS